MEPRAQIPPPQTQMMSDSPTEPACSSTPLGEMNIPEPMMFPEEIMIHVVRVVVQFYWPVCHNHNTHFKTCLWATWSHKQTFFFYPPPPPTGLKHQVGDAKQILFFQNGIKAKPGPPPPEGLVKTFQQLNEIFGDLRIFHIYSSLCTPRCTWEEFQPPAFWPDERMFPHTSAWFCRLRRERTCKSARRLSGSKRRLHKRASWIQRSNATFTTEAAVQAAIIPAWLSTCEQATRHWIIKSKAGVLISKPERKSKWNLNNVWNFIIMTLLSHIIEAQAAVAVQLQRQPSGQTAQEIWAAQVL